MYFDDKDQSSEKSGFTYTNDGQGADDSLEDLYTLMKKFLEEIDQKKIHDNLSVVFARSKIILFNFLDDLPNFARDLVGSVNDTTVYIAARVSFKKFFLVKKILPFLKLII